MNFIKADTLPFDPRPQMGKIFAEGFYSWLRLFSKDKDKLTKALMHIFDLSCFFVAVQNNEIAAITACTDGRTPPISLDKKILCDALGFVRGSFAHWMLKKYLVENHYPFELSPQTGSIEFVATALEYRGQGFAGRLITHIMSVMPYDEYVLEVAYINKVAVRLYEKLGFNEFKRKPAPKGSGIGYFLYMKCYRTKIGEQTHSG